MLAGVAVVSPIVALTTGKDAEGKDSGDAKKSRYLHLFLLSTAAVSGREEWICKKNFPCEFGGKIKIIR